MNKPLKVPYSMRKPSISSIYFPCSLLLMLLSLTLLSCKQLDREAAKTEQQAKQLAREFMAEQMRRQIERSAEEMLPNSVKKHLPLSTEIAPAQNETKLDRAKRNAGSAERTVENTIQAAKDTWNSVRRRLPRSGKEAERIAVSYGAHTVKRINRELRGATPSGGLIQSRNQSMTKK